jgi:hypothetical protein
VRERLADVRCHDRPVQLDRPHRVLVREGALRDLQVEPVEPEDPRGTDDLRGDRRRGLGGDGATG